MKNIKESSLNRKNFIFFEILIAIVLLGMVISCDSGVEPSPDPGMLRVTLQANPADTMVVLNQDTIYSDPRDSVNIKIFQGRVYRDSIFSFLYQNLDEYIQEDHEYNLFNRGEDNNFKEFVVFESLLPPENYNVLQFGIDADFMLLTYGFFSGGIGIPIESSPDLSPLQVFNENIEINEGRITEINLIIDPFQSVERYRDIFRFIPVIRVNSIKDVGSF